MSVPWNPEELLVASLSERTGPLPMYSRVGEKPLARSAERVRRKRVSEEEGGLPIDSRPLITDQPAEAGGKDCVGQLPLEHVATACSRP